MIAIETNEFCFNLNNGNVRNESPVCFKIRLRVKYYFVVINQKQAFVTLMNE